MPQTKAEEEPELRRSMKKVTWQYDNCLSCVYFKPNDPLNADLFDRGLCVHPKLKSFELIISGRDWCNLYKEIPLATIDALQEKAMNG